MGQCQYALKARFPRKKLGKIFPDIMTFWKQGHAAEDWYQEHRDCTEHLYDKDCALIKAQMEEFKKLKEKFWFDFKEQFPLVAEMLKPVRSNGFVNGVWTDSSAVMTHDPRNGLSHVLNFGQPDDEPDAHGDILCVSTEVSRSADWTGLSKFLKKKFKAQAVKWVSEEDTSLSDFLDV
jgi:hypothetical protein